MRKRKGREKNQEDLKFTQAFLLKKYLLNTYWVLDSFFPTGDRAAKKAESVSLLVEECTSSKHPCAQSDFKGENSEANQRDCDRE